MENTLRILSTLTWILSYSCVLLNITFFTVLYIRYKVKMELSFNVILCNLLLITIIIMVSTSADIDQHTLLCIIMNSVSTLFLSIPYFLYTVKNLEKRYYILLLVLFVMVVVSQNIILQQQRYFLFGPLYGVGYTIFLLPIFIKKTNENKGGILHKQFNKMGRDCFLITLGFFIPIILLYKLYNLPYILNIFIGIFLIAYQLPGLLYCKI